MDMISAALGLEYGSDEEMRALAEKLRKEKRAADVFSLSPTFEKQAAAQQQNIMSSAERAGLARAKELDRQSAEKRQQMAADASGRRTGDLYQYLREVRLPDGSVVVAGLNNETNQMEVIPGSEGMTPSPMTENQSFRASNKVLNDVNFVTRLTGALTNADSLLKEFSTEGEFPTPWEDISGMGRYSGKKGVLGKGARLVEEFTGAGEKADLMFSAMEEVRHLILQEGAGLTQSINEMAARRGIEGGDLLTNPKVFAQNYDWIKDRVYRELQMNYLAMPEGMKQEWDQNFAEFPELNPMVYKPERLTFPKTEGSLWNDLLPDFGGSKSRVKTVRSNGGMTPKMIKRQEEIDALEAELNGNQ